MIEKLHEKNEDLRTNIKIGLVNISELPEGFLKITRNMADQIDHLDEVEYYINNIGIWIQRSDFVESATSSTNRLQG